MPTSTRLSLWTYAATGGSLAVTASGVVSLAVPAPWGLPAWVAMAVVSCTAVGLLADRFVTLEEERWARWMLRGGCAG